MNLFVSLQTVRQAGFASAWKSRSSYELKSFICGKIDEIITGSWCEGGGGDCEFQRDTTFYFFHGFTFKSESS